MTEPYMLPCGCICTPGAKRQPCGMHERWEREYGVVMASDPHKRLRDFEPVRERPAWLAWLLRTFGRRRPADA